MKWQVTDKKYNPATGKTQEYNIAIDTTEKDNMVEVRVTVPVCHRDSRPVTWNSHDVIGWLKENNIVVESIIRDYALENTGTCTRTYSFVKKRNDVKQVRKNKTNKNSTKSPTVIRPIVTTNTITPNSSTKTK
tara:strand:+ start:10895 stop:11293 length:399 start_codon:yes stop_codon:yes gene_type:complete